MPLKFKILYFAAFGFLPYSIPCWIVGTILYLAGVGREEEDDAFLPLVLCAPIGLPALALNYLSNLKTPR